MRADFTGYSSAVAITPHDTNLVNVRAIYVGGAGNVAVQFPGLLGTTVTFTAPPVGTILPLLLEGGRVMTASTATLMIGLS